MRARLLHSYPRSRASGDWLGSAWRLQELLLKVRKAIGERPRCGEAEVWVIGWGGLSGERLFHFLGGWKITEIEPSGGFWSRQTELSQPPAALDGG